MNEAIEEEKKTKKTQGGRKEIVTETEIEKVKKE